MVRFDDFLGFFYLFKKFGTNGSLLISLTLTSSPPIEMKAESWELVRSQILESVANFFCDNSSEMTS